MRELLRRTWRPKKRQSLELKHPAQGFYKVHVGAPGQIYVYTYIRIYIYICIYIYIYIFFFWFFILLFFF